MFRPLASSARRTAPRRGALLIAVLGLLTLFAIFALFFVFYADNEATSARIARDAEVENDSGPPDDFAIAAFNASLRSILFDDFDNPAGVLNSLRGHSLARSMYNGQIGASYPFTGIGTFHENAPHGADRAAWINFSSPFTIPAPSPQAGTYWLDPEWTQFRTNTMGLNNLPGTIPGHVQAFVPKNAPYTYPDLKDLILASLSPATGEVLVPSLHRNWLFNANNPNVQLRLAPWNPADIAPASNTAQNTDWVTPEGRTRILRPRPIDQLTPLDFTGAGLPFPLVPGLANYTGAQLTGLYNLINSRIATGQIIPYPPFNADGSYSGDLQNLMGGVGVQRNDSILIDIGIPPQKWNGKWIKPLASILLTDLDGLLNLNAHGNMRGGYIDPPVYDPQRNRGYHRSYNGFGPHEVNLGAVLGNQEAVNIVQARYGIPAWQPGAIYSAGSFVVNAGNFYRCVSPAPPGAMSGPAPGPVGNLTTPTADGGVAWINLGIGARPWTPGTSYSAGDVVVNNNRYYITFNGGTSGAVGPSGSYSTGSPYNDSGVFWVDVMDARIGLARNATTMTRFLGRTGIPQYAAVNFDAGGNLPAGSQPQAPSFITGNPFQTVASFPNTGTQSFFNDVSAVDTYFKALNHPLLFNTHDWPSGFAGRRVFGFGDIKRFNMRYAADRDYYQQSEVSRSGVANTSLVGTYGGNGYRLDPAHYSRGLVTTFSSHLDRPYQVSNFFTNAPPSYLTYTAPNQLHPINQTFVGTVAPGSGTDYNGPTDLRNPRAALGGIDLNRPLADYRTNTSLPLSVTNIVASPSQAWVDRHNLARDILGRLILATGAQATVFPGPIMISGVSYQAGDIRIDAAVGSQEHNAIRYLAQLAANQVDLIDSDDISTPFSWETGPAWTTPRTITQVTTADIQGMLTQATTQTGGVVFGVEKPRLVINEAYGEITNEPGETFTGAAMGNARVRFWVELMNPTSAPYGGTGATTEPLGTGAVELRPAAAGFSPYQLQITQLRAGVNLNDLTNPTNTTGTLNTGGVNQSLTFDFSTAAGRTVTPLPAANPYLTNTGILLVGPQPYNAGTTHPGPVEFSPNTAIAPWSNMVQGNAFGAGSTMEYALMGTPATTDLQDPTFMQNFRNHAVLLRRLANPYLMPGADNPYITVDVMNYVPAYDAVVRGGGGGDTTDRTGKGGGANTTTVGYEDIGNRFAVGKVQPYAGYSAQGVAGGANNVTEIGVFPQSMVIRQNPNPLLTGEPQHTFSRMNGRNPVAPAAPTVLPALPAPTTGLTDTIMAPSDWFVHYDRPLVNQLELFSLQAVKPHLVTQYTIQPPTVLGGAIRRNLGLAPWLGFNAVTGQAGFDTTTNRTNNGLFRALESLRIKPWMHGVGFGGKQHGKINLNMVQDPRILDALFDPQTGNVFNDGNATQVPGGVLNVLYTGQGGATPIPGLFTNAPGSPLAGSRTVNSQNRAVANPFSTVSGGNQGFVQVPFPGPTYDDVRDPLTGPNFNTFPPYDRPFRGLGASEYAPDGSLSVLAARAGSGLQDTILRVNPVTGAPLLSVPGQAQPYLQAEMARKMFNNTTTTSHAFGVTITIVFHEVRMNGLSMEVVDEGAGNRFRIGKEVYKEIPGDLRQQFYAVVDRANLVVKPFTYWTPNTPYPVGSIVVNGPNSYICAIGGISAPAGGPTGTGSTVGDGGVVWSYTPLFQSQPFTTEFSGRLDAAPSPPPPPGGYLPHPPGTYNLYLSNSIPIASTIAYPRNGYPHSTTFHMDGRPITIGAGGNYTGPLVVGTGTNQEVVTMNYVNEDGSINVNRLPANLNIVHAAGEVVASFVTGNPGPVNPLISGLNPSPFDPLNQNPANPYRQVVPYAQRVR